MNIVTETQASISLNMVAIKIEVKSFKSFVCSTYITLAYIGTTVLDLSRY